jgi:hypothetical protein
VSPKASILFPELAVLLLQLVKAFFFPESPVLRLDVGNFSS